MHFSNTLLAKHYFHLDRNILSLFTVNLMCVFVSLHLFFLMFSVAVWNPYYEGSNNIMVLLCIEDSLAYSWLLIELIEYGLNTR